MRDQTPARRPARPRAIERLSTRELEVLQQLAYGCTVQEAAVRLGIGFATVRTHMRSIYEKLQVNTRSKATQHFFDAVSLQRSPRIGTNFNRTRTRIQAPPTTSARL